MTKWRVILAVGVLLSATAACSSDGGSAVDTTAVAVETTAAAVETTASAPDTSAPAPATTTAPAAEWETITAPSDCMCFDGAEFTYWTRTANPAKVMFFMEGGGACFDAQTCAPDSTAFKRVVGDGPATRTDGIFDFANPANPFADWSIVYVPYCPGYILPGNAPHDYFLLYTSAAPDQYRGIQPWRTPISHK